MKTKLTKLVLGVSACIALIVSGASNGNCWGKPEYTSVREQITLESKDSPSWYNNARDLFNVNFEPKNTGFLGRHESRMHSAKDRRYSKNSADQTFAESVADGGNPIPSVWFFSGLNDFFEKDRLSGSGTGKSFLTAIRDEDGRLTGRQFSGSYPTGDETTYRYSEEADSISAPKHQLHFSYSRSVPEIQMAPFPAGSLKREPNFSPYSDLDSFLRTSGNLLLPGHIRLGGIMSMGWSMGDGISSNEDLAGMLYNNEELETNPFLRYFSSFKSPQNPVTVKTSFKSFASNSPNDCATDFVCADRFPFTKHDASFDAKWNFDVPVSLNFGYRFERWERDPEYWENASTDEQTSRIGVKVSPLDWLNLTATFSQSIRTGSDYHFMEANPEQPEQILLPKFSLADRNRSRIDLAAEFTPVKNLNLSVSYGFADASYDNSVFNLIDGRSWDTGIAIRWLPFKSVALTADYKHEEFRTHQSSGSAGIGGIIATTDILDTISGGVDLTLIPEKLSFISRGSYSVAQTDFKVAAMQGGPGKLVRVENFLQYKCSERLSFKFGYLFEEYGAGQNGTGFDPLLDGFRDSLRGYTAHIAIGVLNYQF
jgi:hypothetical protein